MRAGEQLGFLELFETAKPANPLLCHQDFLEKLAAHGRDAIGRRATLLMQRLAVDARRQHYKPTQGANGDGGVRGWAATAAAIFTPGGRRRTRRRCASPASSHPPRRARWCCGIFATTTITRR